MEMPRDYSCTTIPYIIQRNICGSRESQIEISSIQSKHPNPCTISPAKYTTTFFIHSSLVGHLDSPQLLYHGYCTKCCNKHEYMFLFLNKYFGVWGRMPSYGITGSYERSCHTFFYILKILNHQEIKSKEVVYD